MRELTTTYPYACFACRRSFKRHVSARFEERPATLTCPACAGEAVCLCPKFKPPRRDDLEQWRKARDLVAAGCFFYGGGYPEHRREVSGFVEREKPYIERVMKAAPDYFLAITRVAAAAVI